jgi:hypothetical protein
MPSINGKNVNSECSITFGIFDIIMFWTHEPHWMTLKTLQNIWHRKVYLLLILYWCHDTWLVFGVSHFAFNNAFTLMGIDVTSFYTISTSMLVHSSCNFFQRSSLTRGEVIMESEAPVHFVPKVYHRIHVGRLWIPWQYCDVVIIELFDCWLVGII